VICGFLAVSQSAAKDGRQESTQSFTIGSAANVNKDTRGSIIKQPGHADRIDLSSGTTLMQDVTYEAHSHSSGVGSPSMMRWHEKLVQGRPTEKVSLADLSKKKKTRVKDGPGVTWTHCGGTENPCKCEADPTKRRATVIRLMAADEVYPNELRAYENSYYRQHYHGHYTHTEMQEFMKGFTTETKAHNNHEGDFAPVHPHALQLCGGGDADMVDCEYEPVNCTFGSTNTLDAQEGEYCCDPQKKYCSYKCKLDEEFECPHAVEENNMPGGLNPAVNRTKGCFIASYCEDDSDFESPDHMDDTDVQKCE
jgi:hypothetical protein